MKLSEWARRQGVGYQTAWRWVKNGRMPVPAHQTPSGTWTVDQAPQAQWRAVAYCRVSSAGQKADLDRQMSRVAQEATTQGLSVSEVGSGLDGRRRKLHRLLADPDVSVMVVQHRNRIAWLGSNTSNPPWPRPGVDLWSWTRPPMLWCGT